MIDAFDAFIKECLRHPLLTPEQEIIFGRQVQEHIPLTKLANTRSLTKSEQRTLRVGANAKERMIKSNLRLVVKLAGKYGRAAKHLTKLDIVQEGCLGLVRAVEKFDPSRGYRFTTYAYWWIRQAITRALNQMDTDIRMPYSIADRLPRLGAATQKLTHKLGRSPTRAELAADVEMPDEELALLLHRSQRIVSLDKGCKDDGEGTSLVDLIPDPKTTNIEAVMHIEEMEQLKNAFRFLNDDERLVMRHRYEVEGAHKLTLKELAARLGSSRQHASDVERRAMVKLRRTVRSGAPIFPVEQNTTIPASLSVVMGVDQRNLVRT